MQDRVELLSQAIELCRSLAEVLRVLGPKHASDVFQTEQPSPRQQQVRSLENSLDEAFRSATEARNEVLAPASRLSDDILRLFFLNSQLGSNTLQRSRFGYTIASVCRRWRSVALNAASLWSFLHLPTTFEEPSADGDAQCFGPREELTILRSQNTLMTVELDFENHQLSPGLAQSFSTRCANRVKDLTIALPSFLRSAGDLSAIRLSQQCIQCSAATLQKLTITGGELESDDDDDDDDDPPDFDQDISVLFSTQLPTLQEAYFWGIILPEPASDFGMLRVCRRLTLQCLPEQRFFVQRWKALFTTCECLEDLSLYLSDYSRSANPRLIEPVCLARLRALTVDYEGCSDTGFPFTLLLAPALVSLEVSSDEVEDGGTATLASAIDGMLLRSSCALDSLSVGNIGPVALGRFLWSAPTVRTLLLSFAAHYGIEAPSDYREALLSILRPESSDQPCILPALEALCLSSFPASEGSLNSIYNLLERRQAARSPIRSLKLGYFGTSYHSMPPATEAAIKVASLLDTLTIEQDNCLFDKETEKWRRVA